VTPDPAATIILMIILNKTKMSPWLVNISNSFASFMIGIILSLVYENQSVNSKIGKFLYFFIGSCLLIAVVFVLSILTKK
jgi:hypothetical protein